MKAEHWPSLLRLAQLMQLTPRAFWLLSYKEWRALTEKPRTELSRAEFDALAARFPDNPHG